MCIRVFVFERSVFRRFQKNTRRNGNTQTDKSIRHARGLTTEVFRFPMILLFRFANVRYHKWFSEEKNEPKNGKYTLICYLVGLLMSLNKERRRIDWYSIFQFDVALGYYIWRKNKFSGYEAAIAWLLFLFPNACMYVYNKQLRDAQPTSFSHRLKLAFGWMA